MKKRNGMRRAVMALLAAAVLCGCGAAEPDDNARGRLTDGGGNTVSSGNPETGGSSPAGGNTESGKTGTNGNAGIPGGLSDKFDPSLVSDEYLVGFDYFTGDFLEYAPTVIAKVRYDGRLEVSFNHTLSNGDPYVETMLFDLSDQQYQNIESGINLKKLYELDPQEPDPMDVCDGGYSYLFIYDKDGNTYKECGGFCPNNKDFNGMRRVVYENLPVEFRAYCDRYKTAWVR